MEPHLERALTKSEHVYELLRERAKHGHLRPLRRLKPADLDREFRAGVTPARDALLRLHAEGYVRSDAGRGYWTKLYRHKEQRDLQTMLLMCVVYSVDAAARFDATRLRAAQDRFGETNAAVASDASLDGSRARIEAQDHLFRQVADISGNEIVPRLLRNALDRTYFPRVLDAEDPDVAARVADHIHAVCDGGVGGRLDAAVAAAFRLAAEWSDRLEAVVARANAIIEREKFP